MKQKALEWLMLFVLGTAATSLVGWGSGYIQVARSAKAFFPTGLTELTAKVESATEHSAEVQALMVMMRTQVGYCEMFQTDRPGVAMVSSRAPFKNKDFVTVTNISGDETRSTDVTIIGSFAAKDDVLLRVSPDVAKILGLGTERIRIEVKPVAK